MGQNPATEEQEVMSQRLSGKPAVTNIVSARSSLRPEWAHFSEYDGTELAN